MEAMRRSLASALAIAAVLLAAAPMAAAAGPVDLVPLAYHPYPDSADPLGVPAFTYGNNSWGYFETHYSFYDEDRNGFDFPSMVVDGVEFIEGAPGGDYEPTLAAYREAFDEASLAETPFTIAIASRPGPDAVEFTATITSVQPMDERGLVLRWVLAEDDVWYRPPPALSNGVFIHRFTVRALAPRAPAILDLGDGDAVYNGRVELDPAWDRSKLYLAVWIQNEDEASRRFAYSEVPQAAMHFTNDLNETVQDRKAVLMEMFTATWCAACLFGDSALHALATEHGFASTRYVESSWTYVREPEVFPAAAGLLLGALIAAVALPPGGPGGLLRRLAGRWSR